jgi:cytochrome c-type biogenesis protein CcsB
LTGNPSLLQAAQLLFGLTFVAYVAATVLYVSGLIGKGFTRGNRFLGNERYAFLAHTAGTAFHFLAILARWQGSGQWPTSNMYEFLGFLAFTSMVAFQVINRIYALPLLGALISPVGVVLLTYAYVFPFRVQPLIPALQSYWLPLHVSSAALGEGFFAVAFGAALLYLLRTHHQMSESEKRWGPTALEGLFYLICMFLAFLVLAIGFRYTGQQWLFGDRIIYHLPPLIGPVGFAAGSKGPFLGVNLPLAEAAWWMKGKHVNTLLYALVFGALLYWSLRRFVFKGRIGDYLAEKVTGDAELMDEISYRAVAIGYPIFTLGAIVFAMIWAKEAWNRYWAWDPKETWALIAWLTYSAYLHFRITRGWEGRRSAWIAVLGFGVILFTLVGVNLLIVGMHSYAGGD